MKVYLKLFLAAAIPYALALSLLLRDPVVGSSVGVTFGLLIALVFGTLQIRSMQGKKRADDSYAVHQSREIEIDRPFEAALKLAKASLQAMPGLTITREGHSPMLPHDEHVLVEARTGLNWETYGEKITLHVIRLDDNTSLLRIESRPRLRTTLIDYGRNLHLVNAISQYVREHTAADHLRLKTPAEEERLYADAAPLLQNKR